MNILIIGNDDQLAEAQRKFGSRHSYQQFASLSDASVRQGLADALFDFTSYAHPDEVKPYVSISNIPVFVNAAFVSLSRLFDKERTANIFGFCGLPTFLDREVLEVSMLHQGSQPVLAKTCEGLATNYQLVADRAGLVTPRVICMIINEAYSTVMEGTATREDIDLAMKLGTNYPWGPFEWASRIGEKNVCRLLEAVKESTGDEHYNVCELLKTVSKKS
ncbi:MAG: 3-hydroxyacyl-CoA dehydrogenase [Cyclobacteriaceae bacterium]|nr:3-hydroxyacyl-CoA dehydrogenase [Cyclobacteriaceae bacterium]